ncbi:hypothetical protein [Planctomicrobium piriforme]|uniref:Uncharacterized protein n=1 Tax=Planctomicrobium piriforme TaxID=1576369 RepID=A0A1I3SH14_9PLAN|nr:hypothetical protein [Planctomicrobium piriforme]SFJ57029.1 hypothetical protein SAMN05421753_1241 [Planctomicrobium piriforme]
MQFHRRLKLAVVLLLAAGLLGGVAFWFFTTRLSDEEQRLVGRWETTDESLRLNATSQVSRLSEMELFADRRVIRKELWFPHFRESWRAENNQLILTFDSANGVPGLLDPVIDLLDRFPLTRQTVTRKFEMEVTYQIHWKGDDEAKLEQTGHVLKQRQHSYTMRRIRENK